MVSPPDEQHDTLANVFHVAESRARIMDTDMIQSLVYTLMVTSPSGFYLFLSTLAGHGRFLLRL